MGGGIAAVASAQAMLADSTLDTWHQPNTLDVTELAMVCAEAAFTFAIVSVWLNVAMAHSICNSSSGKVFHC